ncbi:MAG: hypothetical protein KBH71_06030 [Anaerolineae bacterium]|nr:hypothetical protein [Anaerolineae bacterium]
MHWILTVPADFSLKELLLRSRWLLLPPFSPCRSPECLERVERLSSGQTTAMNITQTPAGLQIQVELHLNAAEVEELSQKTWRMLRLGETFTPFLERAREDADLQAATRQGVRFLRGADFFEDLLKALLLAEMPLNNAAQRLAQLVDRLGDPLPANPTRHALPTAGQVLAEEEVTQRILGVERGTTILHAARYYQHHDQQLERLLVTVPPLPDLLTQLNQIPGMTNSARAYLLLALGRYECVPATPDLATRREVARFDQWQPWGGLVYWLEHAPQ